VGRRRHILSGTVALHHAAEAATAPCGNGPISPTLNQKETKKDKAESGLRVEDLLQRISGEAQRRRAALRQRQKDVPARWIDEDQLQENLSLAPCIARRILKSIFVHAFVLFVVILDVTYSMYLIFGGELPGDMSDEDNLYSKALDVGILTVLSVELILRILAVGKQFFYSMLNVFEALIIIFSIMFQIIEASFPVSIGRALRPAIQVSRILRRGVQVPIYLERAWRQLDDMMDSVVDNTVRQLIGDVMHLPPENITSHMSRGHFRLEKVHVLPGILTEIHAPFYVKGGLIELLDVDLNVVFRHVWDNTFGVVEITIHNIHLVLSLDPHLAMGNNATKYTCEEVRKRKATLTDLLGRHLDVLAVRAARNADAKMRAREAALSEDPTGAMYEGQDEEEGEDREREEEERLGSKDNAAFDAGGDVAKDFSKLLAGMGQEQVGDQPKQQSQQQQMVTPGGQAPAAPRRKRQVLRNALRHPLNALKDCCACLCGRVRGGITTAVFSQVSAVNVSMRNISLQYEDSEPTQACASGGAKLGSLLLRMERGSAEDLTKTVDFRAQGSWECSSGVEQHPHAKSPGDMRVAVQVERLSAWWDTATSPPDDQTQPFGIGMESDKRVVSQRGVEQAAPPQDPTTDDTPHQGNCDSHGQMRVPSTPHEILHFETPLHDGSIVVQSRARQSSLLQSYRDEGVHVGERAVLPVPMLAKSPAIAAKELHRSEVRERLQIAALRAAATVAAEREAAKTGLASHSSTAQVSTRSSGPLSSSLGDQWPLDGLVIRQPSTERVCRLLPHTYLLVPCTISLHAVVQVPSKVSKGPPQPRIRASLLPHIFTRQGTNSTALAGDSMMPLDREVDEGTGKDASKSKPLKRGSSSQSSLGQSKKSRQTASMILTPIFRSDPMVDIDALTEELVVRVDRAQLESLMRLMDFIHKWQRLDECIQWKPVRRPLAGNSQGSANHTKWSNSMATAGVPGSPLYENVCRDWWRYGVFMVLRQVLPFNRTTPSKLLQVFELKRRSRFQVFLLLLYMKLFRQRKRASRFDVLKERLKKSLKIGVGSRQSPGGPPSETEATASGRNNSQRNKQASVDFQGVKVQAVEFLEPHGPWDADHQRSLEELQVALPIRVVLMCRYGAMKKVAQRTLATARCSSRTRGKNVPPSVALLPQGSIVDQPTSELRPRPLPRSDSLEVRTRAQRRGNVPSTQDQSTDAAQSGHATALPRAAFQLRVELKNFIAVVLEAPGAEAPRKVVTIPTAPAFPASQATHKPMTGVTHKVAHLLAHPHRPLQGLFHRRAAKCGGGAHEDVHSARTCKRQIVRMRMSSFYATAVQAAPDSVFEALLPRTAAAAAYACGGSSSSSSSAVVATAEDATGGGRRERTGTGVRFRVGSFRCIWCEAPPGARSLRPIFCFHRDGKCNEPSKTGAMDVQITHLPPSPSPVRGVQGVPQILVYAKLSPFTAAYNVPVVNWLKALLVTPPCVPPFGPDPLGLLERRWLAEMRAKQSGRSDRRFWTWIFNSMSGATFRRGILAGQYSGIIDMGVSDFVRVQQYTPNQKRKLLIEHVQLPSACLQFDRSALDALVRTDLSWPMDALHRAASAAASYESTEDTASCPGSPLGGSCARDSDGGCVGLGGSGPEEILRPPPMQTPAPSVPEEGPMRTPKHWPAHASSLDNATVLLNQIRHEEVGEFPETGVNSSPSPLESVIVQLPFSSELRQRWCDRWWFFLGEGCSRSTEMDLPKDPDGSVGAEVAEVLPELEAVRRPEAGLADDALWDRTVSVKMSIVTMEAVDSVLPWGQRAHSCFVCPSRTTSVDGQCDGSI